MEKKKISYKEFINLGNVISFAIMGVISVIAFFIYYFTHENAGVLRTVDAFFVGFIVALGVSLFSVLTHFGAFDLMAVGFSNMINVHFRKDFEAKYDGVVDYQERKKIQRQTTRFRFVAYLLVALIFFILFISDYFLHYYPLINK